MSTADFSMSYSAMKQLISEITGLHETFETMCNNLDSLVNSLDGQWQGAAQKEFAAAYSKLRPKLKAIGEMLGKYPAAISNVSGQEAETEASNASLFERRDIPPLYQQHNK